MELNLVFAAIMLGLAGSFHCAGMCGPIALAMPLNTSSMLNRIKGAFVYNFGRAITYSIMGALFGLISSGFTMAGFQKWVSIAMGTIMIISILFPSLLGKRFNPDKGFLPIVSKLKVVLGSLLRKQSAYSLFLIGLLNGLLPCGLVYIALAGALASGNTLSGALFMFIFGIGTIPMLFFISVLGNSLSISIRRRMNKAIPVIVIFIGAIYIIRGMGLGIPYLSPSDSKLHLQEKSKTEMHKCCSQ